MARAVPCLLVLAWAALPVGAQTEVDWYTVDAGGGTSAAGRFAVRGTAGQPDAEEVSLCSADGGTGCVQPRFEVTGGYWVGPALPGTDVNGIFRDGFEP